MTKEEYIKGIVKNRNEILITVTKRPGQSRQHFVYTFLHIDTQHPEENCKEEMFETLCETYKGDVKDVVFA